jgi:cytochrome c oxidase subunit 2
MHVNYYERLWMWGAAAIIVAFLGLTGIATISQGRMPPSHVETIDPQSVFADSRFTPQGVVENPDGSVEARVIAMMFTFLPRELRVPVGRPVTFRITSTDVMHGFQIVGTNGNTMVAPGYVSQFTMTFDEPGEYLIVCNEYCGLNHHNMFATLIAGEEGQ